MKPIVTILRRLTDREGWQEPLRIVVVLVAVLGAETALADPKKGEAHNKASAKFFAAYPYLGSIPGASTATAENARRKIAQQRAPVVPQKAAVPDASPPPTRFAPAGVLSAEAPVVLIGPLVEPPPAAPAPLPAAVAPRVSLVAAAPFNPPVAFD